MKRIDRIILNASRDSNEQEKPFLQEDVDAGAQKNGCADDFNPATVTQYTRERVAERNDDVDLPVAPLNSAVITLVAACTTIERDNDVDSPVAPTYSPLTPLVTSSKKTERENVDSSVAPNFSPLTPVVAASKMIEDERSEGNSSPLRSLSPGTLELFESLGPTFPASEEFGPLSDKTNEDNNEEETKGSDNYARNKTELCEDKQTNCSSDTDSDYVPDSADSDDSCSVKKKARNNNDMDLRLGDRYIPESDSDDSFDDGIPRSSVQTHAAIIHTSENQNTGVRCEISNTSNNSRSTDVYSDKTIDDLISNLETQDKDMETQNEHQEGRPKKGRKRKYPDHPLAVRKERKYKNLPYHGKNKRMESKVFHDYACTCIRQCFNLISQEKRKEEFEKFITLGSYEAQALYILTNVKESSKARSYTVTKNTKTGKKKPREYRRSYSICNVEVCKDMFLHNFQISSKKVDVSLKKKRSGKTINDQRGKAQGGWNKTSEDDVKFIKEVINSLPKYESHYRRETNSECQYLKPDMTIQKIYDLYTDELKAKHGTFKKPVSFETLKRIFYSNFNLRCKTLKKDTCNRCDTFKHKIKNCNLAGEKLKLEEEKKEHLKQAEFLRKQMNEDLLHAKTNKSFECLTFDLEKTLPLPRIPTNIVFYKRQLWLYNCGIHVGSDNTGHCNVWLEGEAGRGSQEVGSCLIRFIKNNLDQQVEDLVLWSDCCGGQNRNIKIVLMLKAVLSSHPSLKTITFKYLESGHTFLPNDTDFSKIEYALKYHERIYTADEYINVMKSCKRKNPLKVYRMQKEDFLSVNKIEKKIVNRKTFTTKDKVNWLKTKEILLKKDDQFSLFMKSSDGLFQQLNIEKKLKGKSLEISEKDFELLWPNGKEIAQAKLDDLKSMFDLIPKDCLEFYKTLQGNENIVEDIEGFGCTPDFD